MRARVLCLAVLLIWCSQAVDAQDWMWAKGNLHTHSTNSDGDSHPQVVADWYRENGYDFLVISDHWHVTDYSDIDAGPEGKFVLIHGDETGVTRAPRPIHLNSIGVPQQIPGPQFTTFTESISTLINKIRDAGGVPMVNHPNFRWSFGHRELLPIDTWYLLEIYNGAPGSNNSGNIAHLSVEQTWDILLSNGRTVYATATDDAHVFKEFSAGRANPGRGWVYVRVPELTSDAILKGLSEGDFYASTGVELNDVSFDGDIFRISVNPQPERTYLIRLIGIWGSILHEQEGTSVTLRVIKRPVEHLYIRCKVIADDGTVAWTQAFRIDQ